jgi:selenocysteine lyase/cysteine desulfurase
VPTPEVVAAVSAHLGARCEDTGAIAGLAGALCETLTLPPPLTFRHNTTQAIRDLLRGELLHRLDGPSHGRPAAAPGRLLCADVQHPAVREAWATTWSADPDARAVVRLQDLVLDCGQEDPGPEVLARFAAALDEGPVTAAVIPHVVWFNGAALDAAAICGALKARQPELLTIVDGAQAVGQLPLDPALFEGAVDLYVGCGHKWLGGPETLGFVRISPAYVERCARCAAALAAGDVLGEVGGLSGFYAGSQFGTHQIGVARGLSRALEQLRAGPGGVAGAMARARANAEALRAAIAQLPGVRLLGPPAPLRSSVVALVALPEALGRARAALEAEGFSPAAYALGEPPLAFLRLSPGPDLRADEVALAASLLEGALRR